VGNRAPCKRQFFDGPWDPVPLTDWNDWTVNGLTDCQLIDSGNKAQEWATGDYWGFSRLVLATGRIVQESSKDRARIVSDLTFRHTFDLPSH